MMHGPIRIRIFFTCRAYRLAFGFNHPIAQRALGDLSAIPKRPGQGNNPHRAEAKVKCTATPTSPCIYRVRQRIGRFLSVKKIKSIGYHDTVTFIRKYILYHLQK